MSRPSSISSQFFASCLACVLAGACTADTGRDDRAAGGAETCDYLNFDVDGDGLPIAAGDIVESAYAGVGVHIRVYDSDETTEGLGVAFDTANPTGGDNDLSFAGLGNVLINQEHWDAADVAAGRVAEPDDEARGALFELTFDDPVCVKSLVLLDIDFGEDAARIELFDDNGQRVAAHQVDPMGDNVRLDVALPATATCNVRRMTVLVDSSGAMDDVQICKAPSGPEIWTRTYDGGFDDIGNDVATDPDRNVIVAGSAENGTDVDGIVRKYDRNGLLTWSLVIDEGGDDEAFGVESNADCDVVVAGRSAGATDDDLFVRAYDADGNPQWMRTFDGGGQDGAYGVAVDSDDAAVVVGFAEAGAGTDILVRKYASGGALVWTRSANIGADDIGYGVAVGAQRQVAAVGQSDNGTDTDVWVRLYDADGNEMWTRGFDGGADDVARGVAIDADGNVLVAGHAFNGATNDVWVRKYAPNGNTLWTRTFDSGGTDMGHGVATDAAGSVIVTGFVQNATRDGWTRKYDADGVELWTELFDRGAADEGNGVTTDIAGAVIATGMFDNGTDLDLWVSKYVP